MTDAEATYISAIKAANKAAYAAIRAARDTEALPMVNRQRLREIAALTNEQVEEGGGQMLDDLLKRAEKAEAMNRHWQKQSVECWQAFSAMRDCINEVLPMPSVESDLLRGPEFSVSCEAVALAVSGHVSALQADLARVTAERDAERAVADELAGTALIAAESFAVYEDAESEGFMRNALAAHAKHKEGRG